MHALGWLFWLGAAVAVVMSTRNPMILLLLVGEFALIVDRLSQLEDVGAPVMKPGRFALLAVPVGAVFNALTSHYGETVLARLPQGIPLIGGVVTVEAIVYGAVNGLVLSALFYAFTILNMAVPVGELIQYIPRAFYPFAVVSAIAVSFFPTTLRQIRQVREAQAIRGYRMRGIRDWLPLFVPVLVGGLERALQLAESMTSRGFAASSSADTRPNLLIPLVSISGLLFVLGGSVMRMLPAWAPWSLLFLMIGLVFISVAVWKAGRDVKRTRFYQMRWTYEDSFAAIAALFAVVPARLIKAPLWYYTPYPVVSWPQFDLVWGVTLLGLTVPVWLTEKQEEPPA